MKVKKLDDICKIHNGYSLRGRLETVSADGIPAIQLSDTRNGRVDFDDLPRAKFEDVNERFCVKNGDVIFKSRMSPNIAIEIKDFPTAAVLLAPLVKLVVNTTKLIPSYLAWYVNQPPAQLHFDRCGRGQTMRMITRKCLADLEISIPNIDLQKQIVELSDLVDQEAKLMGELTQKRKLFTSFALLEQVRKTRPS